MKSMKSMKSETMYRMDAMRAAGLTPDLTLCVDTIALAFGGGIRTIPNQRWLDLYNDSISVRLAYDQDKYGTEAPAPATITPTPEQPAPSPDFSSMTSQEIYDSQKPKADHVEPPIEGTFVDITPVPKRERIPMDRAVLIATARGYAKEFDDKDHYFAWLLTELADQLETSVDPFDLPRG